ncbi:MAG: C4-dicarboxylate TRAP transporter substrate-binding protein [Alphaproteobacteria bacterium]
MPNPTVVIGALAAALALAMPAVAKEAKVSLGVSPKHFGYTQGWEPYAKRVETQTQGALTFRFFLGGSLFTQNASLDGLRQGVAEATFLVMPYTPAQLPHATFLGDMGLLGRNAKAMAGATMEFLFNCPDCQQEFAAQNTVYLGGYSTDVFNLLCNKTVASLADVKGRKIRSGAAGWNRWIETLGAIPVNFPATDMMQGLQSGAIDCTGSSISNMNPYGLWGAATHATRLPLGTFHSLALIAFNTGFWNGLSVGERKALIDNAAEAHAATTIAFMDESAEIYRVGPSKGLIIVEPKPDLVKFTAEFATQDADRVAEDAEKRGVIRNARVKVQTFIALVRKWEGLIDAAPHDAKAVGAIYQREIFSKLTPSAYGL